MKHFPVVCVVVCFMFLMLLSGASAEENTFTDVPVTHWAYGPIQSLARAGIVKGFPGGTFKPDLKVTREQFAVVLVLTLDIPTDDKAPQIFADIKPDHRSFLYIDAAKAFIPTPSNPKGKFNFNPDRVITREEVAEALVTALNMKKDAKVNAAYLQHLFQDYKNISPDFREEVAVAVYNKIMSGKTNGVFDPKGGLTRAELSVVLNKLLQEKQARQPIPGQPKPAPGPHKPWTIEFNFPEPDHDLVKCFSGTVVSKVYNADDSYMVLEHSATKYSGDSVSVESKTVNMCVYETDLDWFFLGDVLTVNYDRYNNITSYKLEKEAAPHTFLPRVGGAR